MLIKLIRRQIKKNFETLNLHFRVLFLILSFTTSDPSSGIAHLLLTCAVFDLLREERFL